MRNIKQPTKEQVRQYMQRRQSENKPPPMKEIRRQLGWASTWDYAMHLMRCE